MSFYISCASSCREERRKRREGGRGLVCCPQVCQVGYGIGMMQQEPTNT